VNLELQATDCESVAASRAACPAAARRPSRVAGSVRSCLQGLAVIVLGFACYYFISHFCLQSVKVVGRSMVPTLSDSQRYLLNRWIYYFRPPQRQEVVVLCDPSDHGFSVKRVIAAAGDSVYLKDGCVYVNGRKLDEPYLLPGTPTFTFSALKEQLFKCGRDQYFVLGDNRNNSVDSRTYGLVPRQNILGQIIQ
jgi:signal peptidase I